jgi:serine/threonine protein kinase/Flp pilus assembly protein TadD
VATKCPKCHAENPETKQFCGDCGTSLHPSQDIGVTKTIETPVEEHPRGSTFANRYKIIEKLGTGGMGSVYRVEDINIGQDIALKLIKSDIVSDKKTIERFRNELKITRMISHRNVCRMFDLAETEGTFYITMEYVLGEDLKSFIRRSGKLDIPKAISIAKEVCEGLNEAHRLGVVHRDLKSNNIMIDKEGNARIMDFGIARSLRTKGLTGEGIIIGTPEYMSPEQAEAREVDQRSDIYSFGVILYEMVTGRVPFEGETPLGIAIKHKSEIPKDPRELNVQIPEDLSRVILRCMEKDKEKRYQSAGEVRSELSRIEDGVPTAERIEPKKKPTTSKEITVTLRKPWIMIAALVVAVIVIGTAVIYFRSEKPILSPAQQRLVVLPFTNLGPPEDEYFADSITEEIRARLTQIGRLGMIARTSAYQYKNKDKSVQKISEELEVDYILDGTIRWQKFPDGSSRVRIIPELIRASDSTTSWTEIYDKEITDVFKVQSLIAQQVAGALDITLAEDKRKALFFKPTTNMEAYNFYLQGMDYANRSYQEGDQRIAIQMFERAVELDPNFASAYARLSGAYLTLFWQFYYRVDLSLLTKAKEAVDRAYELNPDSPETHWALGYYYYQGNADYDRALEHFYKAQKGMKDKSEVLAAISYVQRRQGKFDQAAVNLKKAIDLDPRSALKTFEIGVSYFFLRNFAESERYINKAISLSPDSLGAYTWKIMLCHTWEGNAKKALKVIEDIPQTVRVSEEGIFVLTLVSAYMFDGSYQKALDFLSRVSSYAISTQICMVPKALLYAQIYDRMGQSELEEEHYDSARRFLEAKVKEWPEDARVHSSLGLAYAGLGHKEEAVREGKKAVELLSVSQDAVRGLYRVEDLARINVMVGEYDAAIDQLEYLLSIPSQISVSLLRLDPTWEPLRDNPRFQKIIKRGK